MVEKLSKALEGLKNLLDKPTSVDEGNISKKEKMFLCVLAADVMVSLKGQGLQNLPVVIENMINLCDDNDSDVRMVAEESLNRVITSLSQPNMLKVQVELHNIIKKNGPARCLRAALTRFGQLSHFIRPNKGRGHVQLLIPALLEIAKREEESIHETLASSFESIFRVLGVFVQDNALKGLIKAFLHNLSSSNAVIRRCSASCIITVVQYCRKPIIFNCYVLNSLLDCVVPVCEDNSVDLILGVLGCLRILLPALVCTRSEEGISGSFGVRKRQDESLLSVDRLIQAYELCLHYTSSKDHNVVAAALETLNQILQKPPHPLESFFLSPSGFSRSYIQPNKENKLCSRSGSEMSVALSTVEEALLLDDSDVASTFSLGDQFRVKPSSSKPKSTAECSNDVKTVENPFKEKSFGELMASQAGSDVDSDTESVISELSVPTNFSAGIGTEEKEVGDEELDRCGSNCQDYLHSPTDSDRVVPTNATDVGTFTDAAVPLIFCARHIAASFLLDGAPDCLKSDRTIRVSIKSLALSCISAVIKLYPAILKMNLTNGQSESGVQGMSDVLLYCTHADPMIRGNVSVLVGSFINSALNESRHFTSDWLSGENSNLNHRNLIEILLKGLQDKSSVCIRQALTALNLCVTRALFSVYNSQFMPLLEYLPALASNSYWLVKVKLVEVLSELPYVCICDLTESSVYQEEVMDCVLLPLLGDEDARVRNATAEALVRIIPVLHNGRSTVAEFGRTLSRHTSYCTRTGEEFADDQSPCLPFAAVSSEPDERIESSLSILVAKLTCSLLVPESKHFLFGGLEALRLLSGKYPTTVYSKGWNCGVTQRSNLQSNLIAVVLSLILTSPFGLDLAAFSSATLLLGNLFAGFFVSSLKINAHVVGRPLVKGPEKLWEIFMNERISIIAEEILSHLLKVLNFYSHLLEEVALDSVVESSVSGTFLPLLSPIRKQDKKPEEKPEEKKTRTGNACRQSAQYAKLEQLLKSAHANYKASLDKAAGDKFLDVLESTLSTLSVVLEVATVKETGRCAEEILSYLLSVVLLRPNSAVICVKQLLKSLFGTNLVSNWKEKKLLAFRPPGLNLFDVLFHLPTELLSEKIRRRDNSKVFGCGLTKPPARKTTARNSDKHWLATYIRLFEPMVVKSLQLYTITADVELQSNVLRLLNQLVRLRVNYCMLDEKQVFVEFVVKQFELIEQGQVPGVETLLPSMFRFLILLSYEKQHSKPIMSMPKIIQLCDGLMASDQSVQSHCIPALGPVVEDIFFSKSPLASSLEEKELETQREVVFCMLLRLAEFPEVMEMLGSVLEESRRTGGNKRWKRWSRQVVDSLLPLLNQDRLRIDTAEAQKSFTQLMSSLSLTVLRPINPLLKALFVEPEDYNCPTSLKRWLSKVTVLLETVLFVGKDALLTSLEETAPNINLTSLLPTEPLPFTDPFHVNSFFQTYKPSETVARFILKVIAVVASAISRSTSSTLHLQQKLSTFFVYTYYILKSGTLHSVAISLRNLLASERLSLANISSVFQNLIHVCPTLTSQFSYLIALLDYCDRAYWTEILRSPLTLPAKLVQTCAVVSLCDHLCDNLSDKDTLHFLLNNCLQELVLLSHETPVREVFITMRRRSDWAVLLEAVSSKTFHLAPPHLVEKLLRLLEITEGPHSGSLLKLLLEKFIGSPRLALSLLAASIASRQAEHLLTLPREKVADQITPQDFRTALDAFRNKNCLKRHSTLWGLLNKLSLDVFHSSVPDPDASEVIEVGHLKDGPLGEQWYFTQVKRICTQQYVVGLEVPFFLYKLNWERMSEIMSCPDFNVKFLKDCLEYDNPRRKKHEHSDELEGGLFEASKSLLGRKLREIREDLQEAREEVGSVDDWAGVVAKLGSREGFQEQFWEICHCLALFLEILSRHRLELDSDWVEGVAEFGVLCVKMMEWESRREGGGVHPKHVESGLRCCGMVLRSGAVGGCRWVQGSVGVWVSGVFGVVGNLVGRGRVSRVVGGKDLGGLSWWEQLDFLLELVGAEGDAALPVLPVLPRDLMESLRAVVVSLCGMEGINSRVVGVPEGCEMQEIGSLKRFIWRFSVIGWRSRQQFEEIWVGLLSVLGLNSEGDVPVEEKAFVVQASATAVEGITALLKSTMLDSVSRKLIHHGRDAFLMQKLHKMPPIILEENDLMVVREQQFLDNLEICERDERYVNGLLSVEYLWTAAKQIRGEIEVYEKHCQELRSIGVDLPSCIYLLTELYNQWIHQASPNIKTVTAALKSSIVMSDLFTDVAQFRWLLDFCLRIEEVVIPEDTVILPLIVLGCCKAAAIVLPDEQVCQKVKKLMLRSTASPCRLSAVEGLLYLLQSHVVCSGAYPTPFGPRNSASRPGGPDGVANIVDTFLPVALQVVHEFRLNKEPVTDEYQRCHWSLIFYLRQHYHSLPKDLRKELVDFTTATLCSRNCSASILRLLARGVQRLLLTAALDAGTHDQLERFSLEITPGHSLAEVKVGLQLVSFFSFLDKKAKPLALLANEGVSEMVIREMERLNVLFEKLKKSSPMEAKMIGCVIWYLMKDLSASDVLTKVIQEFLFPYQPHHRILSGLLFGVFQRAEQSLLEDWVVFSLPSFVQGLPVSMSIWTLNCFFLSASNQPWLRNLFPLLQARVRMAEAKDRKLLCLTGARFYRQLKHDKQKKSFAQTFEEAKTIDSVFQDLLSAIS